MSIYIILLNRKIRKWIFLQFKDAHEITEMAGEKTEIIKDSSPKRFFKQIFIKWWIFCCFSEDCAKEDFYSDDITFGLLMLPTHSTRHSVFLGNLSKYVDIIATRTVML